MHACSMGIGGPILKETRSRSMNFIVQHIKNVCRITAGCDLNRLRRLAYFTGISDMHPLDDGRRSLMDVPQRHPLTDKLWIQEVKA